jgi:hypothetical protein
MQVSQVHAPELPHAGGKAAGATAGIRFVLAVVIHLLPRRIQ